MKLYNDFIYADLSDLLELKMTMERMGKVPKRCVKQAVGAGARVMRKYIKARAPKGKTGNLRRAIRVVHEQHDGRTPKAGSQIVFDRKFNDRLVKYSKNGFRSYYPSSQEYGWRITRKNGASYRTEGKHYMRDLGTQAYPAAEQSMVDKLTVQMEKEWRKKSAT